MANELNILLVEDDPAQSKLFGFAAKKNHPEVKISNFETGEKLLSYLREHPDVRFSNTVVLSDLNLPDMTGLELLSQIQKSSWGNRVRFILFTQVATGKIVEEAYSAGAAAILSKSNSFEEFEFLITSLVRFWSLNKY